MSYIRNGLQVASGVSALLAGALVGTGCEQKSQDINQHSQAKGAFVIIEETAPGRYRIKDEFPYEETKIVLKKLDGSEKLLSEEEMSALIAKEASRIESGESHLVSPDSAQKIEQAGGLSLGEAILASAAGAIIGSWIGSKLFSNPNYQNAKKASYRSPSAYSRSLSSFKKGAKRTSGAKKSGFFKSNASAKRSGGFFGG